MQMEGKRNMRFGLHEYIHKKRVTVRSGGIERKMGFNNRECMEMR